MSIGDVWKTGVTKPLVGDIPLGGLAIDTAHGKAYSTDGSIIFPLSGIDNIFTWDELENYGAGRDDEVILLHGSLRGGSFKYSSSLAGVNDGGIVINGWVRQFNGAISVTWFGAIPGNDYLTLVDSSAAFQAAFDYAVSVVINNTPIGLAKVMKGCSIFVPRGMYLINTRVSKDQFGDDDHVHVKWFGISNEDTLILVNNPDGFLSWSRLNYGLFFEMEDIGIYAAYKTYNFDSGNPDYTLSSGTAIKLIQGDSGDIRENHYKLERVYIGSWNRHIGDTDDTIPVPHGDYWYTGLHIFGGGRLLLNNVYVWGEYRSKSSQTWRGENCYYIENVYSFSFNKVQGYGAQYGLQYINSTDPGPEGGLIDDAVFETKTGVRTTTPSLLGEPRFTIINSHINHGYAGLDITGRRAILVSNCVFYSEMNKAGVINDIVLTNCDNVIISSNTFEFEAAVRTRRNIKLDFIDGGGGGFYGSENIVIRDNIFDSDGVGLFVVGHAKDVDLTGNHWNDDKLLMRWNPNGTTGWMMPISLSGYGLPTIGVGTRGPILAPKGSVYTDRDTGLLHQKTGGDETTSDEWVENTI